MFVKSPSVVNSCLKQGGYEEVAGSIIDDALIIAVFNAIAI